MAIYEPIFKALNKAGIRYVVVGGLAVAMQGHARFTADVDLVVDLEEEPAKRAIEALTALNLQPRAPVKPLDFASKKIRDSWIRERGMQVFCLYDPSDPIRVVDLFVSHPIPFDELWARSEEIALSGVTVRVASIPDLIRMKRESGRSEDLSDIEHLEAILRERKGREGA